jgi:hypothetical protein
VPSAWQRYKTRKNLGLGGWVTNLAARVRHLEAGAQSGYTTVWLGGLAAPSSYITATCQVRGRPLR